MFRSEKGFSLIEALVAIAVFGMASILLMNLMDSYSKVSSEADRKSQMLEMDQFIQTSLTSGGDCLINLRNPQNQTLVVNKAEASSSAGQEISVALKDMAGSSIVEGQVNTLFPKIIAKRLRLKDLQAVTGVAGAYTARVVFAPISSSVEKNQRLYAERTPLSLYLSLNSANKVVGCYGAANGADFSNFCHSLGGNWDINALTCALDPQKQCASLGGVWDATGCHFAAKACPKVNGKTSGTYTTSSYSGGITTTRNYACVDGTWLLTSTTTSGEATSHSGNTGEH